MRYGMTLATITILGLSTLRVAAAPIRQACAPDVKAQCPGTRGAPLMDCLAEHRDQISDGCKIAIADEILERRAKKAAGEEPASAAPQK